MVAVGLGLPVDAEVVDGDPGEKDGHPDGGVPRLRDGRDHYETRDGEEEHVRDG